MTSTPATTQRPGSRWLPPAILLLVGTAMAWWTWGAWLDPLIDFGRELYVPWRITEGEVLFRDIAWFNGPLSQYWNAAVFGVFGVGLRAVVLSNLAVLAGATWLLYRLLRRIAGVWAATAAVAFFLFMFGFAQFEKIANFNWICPYSHEMTHGAALTLLAVYLHLRWTDAGGLRWLAGAGLATGAVALTKPEILAGCGLAIATSFFVLAGTRPVATVLRGALAFAGFAAIPVVLALLLLVTAMPVADAWRGVLGGWAHVFDENLRGSPYYEACLGTDDLGQRLQIMALWSGVWLVAVAVPFAAARLAARAGAHRVWIVAATSIALAGAYLAFGSGIAWRFAWTPLTPFAAVLFVVCAAMAWRDASAAALTRVVLAGLGLGLLAKMLFHARLYHYGFALALPATMLAVVALVDWLPRFADARGGYGAGLRVLATVLLCIPVLGHGRLYAAVLGERQHTVGSGADAFRMDARAEVLNAFARGPQPGTMLVLPEGVMLNYLARQRNPTPYVSFMPPEVFMFGEDRMLASIRENPPEVVVLTQRVTAEYGLPFFGTDYGVEILSWVRSHYRPIEGAKVGEVEPLRPEVAKPGSWSLWVLERKR